MQCTGKMGSYEWPRGCIANPLGFRFGDECSGQLIREVYRYSSNIVCESFLSSPTLLTSFSHRQLCSLGVLCRRGLDLESSLKAESLHVKSSLIKVEVVSGDTHGSNH
jgi:hypothetical protein